MRPSLHYPVMAVLGTLALSSSIHAQDIIVENAYEHLTFSAPIDFQLAPGLPDDVFVVERAGTIQRFRNHPQTSETTRVLDISSSVSTQSEGGLLGVAFHPDFSQNGQLFVHYTAPDPFRSVFARFETNPQNPGVFETGSRHILLEVSQPAANHNGGQIRFGPDGYLYIALGDGGGGGDPDGNGQDRSTLHGNILRIDVDNTSGGRNYAIPADNPFAGNSEGWREEIYAWGFRNPFRFSFDSSTGNLWVADVGQNDREEINAVEKGKNYGWNIMEGSLCYQPSSGCDTSGLELPVYEYGFDGGQSVTGGFVYRGNVAPSMNGRYFYGDFVTGDLWSFAWNGSSASDNQSFGKVSGFQLVCFGEDHAGELYMCLMGEGRIYRINMENVPIDSEPYPERPDRLYLAQNHPNPFNPATNISYYLPENNSVLLEIFDYMGRRITTLVDEVRPAGTHNISFNAEGLPSGIYTFRITAGNESFSRLMTVIK